MSGTDKALKHICLFDFNNFDNFLQLFEITSSWKRFSYFYNDISLSNKDIIYLKRNHECWEKAQQLPHPEAHCRAYPKMKVHLDQIERELNRCRYVRVVRNNFRWYDHGYLNIQGRWSIDKPHLKNKYENEIYTNRAHLCPLFDIKTTLSLIDELPDSIPYSSLEWFKKNGDLRLMMPWGDSRFVYSHDIDDEKSDKIIKFEKIVKKRRANIE